MLPSLIAPGRKSRPVGGRTRLNERSWQAQGLLHFWPTNEGKGEIVRDFGMIPRHGTPNSHASIKWVPGKTSGVITPGPIFENSSNANYGINCGKLKHLVGESRITVACWAYQGTGKASRDGFWGTTRYLSYNIHFSGTTGVFIYVNNAESFPAWATPSPALSTSEFQHHVAVFDLGKSAIADKIQLYINGVDQGAGAAPLTSTSFGSQLGTIDFQLLGGDGLPGDSFGTHYCMWNYPMSADQVKALYTEPWDLYAEDLNRQYFFPERDDTATVISVPVKIFSLTGLAPTVTAIEDVVVAAPSKSFTLAGQTPTIATGANVASTVKAFTLTGLAPAVGTSVAVDSPAKAFTLSGFVPAVASGVSVTAPLQAFVLAGQAPNVGTGVSVATPSKAFALAGFAPLILTGVNIEVPLKSYLLSGAAPAVIARAWTKVTPASTAWTKVTPVSTTWTKI